MNAKCPSCGTEVPVTDVSGQPYLSTHERPNGGKCYYSDKPVPRAAVSGAAAKKAPAKKAPAKKTAKKAPAKK